VILLRALYDDAVSSVCSQQLGLSSRDICGEGCDGNGLLLYASLPLATVPIFCCGFESCCGCRYCNFAGVNDKGNLAGNRVYQEVSGMPQLLAGVQKWIALQGEGEGSGVVAFE